MTWNESRSIPADPRPRPPVCGVSMIGAVIDCIVEGRDHSPLPVSHPARSRPIPCDLFPTDPVTGERDIRKSEMRWL